MFAKDVYVKRRIKLANFLNEGVILLLGNKLLPMNYLSNNYKFRQDSTFLYYIGIDLPGLTAVIDIDNNEVILFGDDKTNDEIIWTGECLSMNELAKLSGINKSEPLKKLDPYIKSVIKNRKLHYFLPYQAELYQYLLNLLNFNKNKLESGVSIDLIKAIIEQRSYKEPAEIKEIEQTINNVTFHMFNRALKRARPGVSEKEIVALMENIAIQHGNGMAFPPIVSIHGETLHNPYYNNILDDNKLLLVDAGAQSNKCYATDITRTYPISGNFSTKQKEIYQIVLDAQLGAISMAEPGIPYKDIHKHASKIIAEGLKATGLLKGDTEEIVSRGAHALFFPHGIGHMMGLDVHDMENLGEVFVGYDDEIKRENEFGLKYLRLGRKLKENFVITVEPGIYFIPTLIKKWKSEKKFMEYVNYQKVEDYLDFSGIRIEDDVLITSKGAKVLGNEIPKKIDDIQNFLHIIE